jgi:hypothetical protein
VESRTKIIIIIEQEYRREIPGGISGRGGGKESF